MKYFVSCLVLLVLCCRHAFAYEVCAVSLDNLEYSYTQITSQGDLAIASWAIGADCDGEVANTDVATMCTDIMAGGQAFCANVDFRNTVNENTTGTGSMCWCRRTMIRADGELKDSIGAWIYVAALSGTCVAQCGRVCAESVAENAAGMRHAIMLLPAS